MVLSRTEFIGRPGTMKAHELLTKYDPYWADRELVKTSENPPDYRMEEPHETMLRKTQEVLESGLGESIMEHGVVNPVQLGPSQILGGHHRALAAAMVDPDMEVPVRHYGGNLSLLPQADPEYTPKPIPKTTMK